MRFDPQVNELLTIGVDEFSFTAHPAIPDSQIPFSIEARKSIVYQIKNTETGRTNALKVFKPAYRGSHILESARRISEYRTLPGMWACQRIVLTRSEHQDLIRRFPDLEYAVLMPWVADRTWAEMIFARQVLSYEQCLALAIAVAEVLTELEMRQLAHCDLSGSNLLVNLESLQVELVDLEDMFSSSVPLLNDFPAGTPGYQHLTSRTAAHGQWHAEGDRFAGAVLLTEVLLWHDRRIVQHSDGEHFFAEHELQNAASSRYALACEVLRNISHDCSVLLERAWSSPALPLCPPLSQWAYALYGTRRKKLSGSERSVGDENDKRLIHLTARVGCPWCFRTLDPLDLSPVLRVFVACQHCRAIYHDTCWSRMDNCLSCGARQADRVQISQPEALLVVQRASAVPIPAAGIVFSCWEDSVTVPAVMYRQLLPGFKYSLVNFRHFSPTSQQEPARTSFETTLYVCKIYAGRIFRLAILATALILSVFALAGLLAVKVTCRQTLRLTRRVVIYLAIQWRRIAAQLRQ